MNLTLYRKNYKGKMVVVGELLPNGSKTYYANIINPNESYEQNKESHKILYYKNNLGIYLEISKVKKQLELDNALINKNNYSLL